MATKKTATTEALAAAAPGPRRTRPASAKHSRKATTAETAPPAPEASRAEGPAVIDHDSIARLAYTYWMDRGGAGGNPADDWFRAEAELRRRAAEAAVEAAAV
jgi:hypothetical protein